MQQTILKFDIQSYWRAGTGRGGGSLLDEKSHRDNYQLPVIPGRTIKGILRDAAWRMEQWGSIQKGSTEKWFGTRLDANGLPIKDTLGKHKKPDKGQLRISSAELEKDLKDYLISIRYENEFRELKNGFYKKLYATAINDEGYAEDQSLRAMEITIPMPLYARLSIDKDDINDMRKCLSLVRSIGSHRTRGLGRVSVSLVESGEIQDAS